MNAARSARPRLRDPITASSRWLNLRWAVVLVIPIGYALTMHRFGASSVYGQLTVAAAACCVVCLACLRSFCAIYLPQWILLGILMIGYYIKFYWIVLDPSILERSARVIREASTSTQALLDAYGLATCGFAGLAMASVLVGLTARRRMLWPRPTLPKSWGQWLSRVLMLALPITIVVLGAATYLTGVSVMGAPAVRLPLRLAGILFYARTLAIPALTLSLMCVAPRGSVRLVAVSLLAANALAGMLLRASRGEMVEVLLLFSYFLVLTTGRATRRQVMLVMGGILLAALLVPMVTEYRAVRALDPSSGFPQALAAVIRTGRVSSGSWGARLLNGIQFIIFRVTGIQMLLAYSASTSTVAPMGTVVTELLTNTSMAQYVTHDILRYPLTANHSAAVSLVGWFYLVGGTWGVVVGTTAFLCVFSFILSGLGSLGLRTLPVARALLLSWYTSLAMEGLLDSQRSTATALVASVLLCEVLFRLPSLLGRRHRPRSGTELDQPHLAAGEQLR